MSDWRRSILPPAASIRRAIAVLTGPESSGIVLVTGGKDRLLGIVADSDIRRGLLRGARLSAPLRTVMNPRPFTLPAGTARARIARVLRRERRANVPLVGPDGSVRGLARMADYCPKKGQRPNWIVLLAGGYGRRLGPLTKDRPKPLLPLHDKPLLETIVERFAAQGFRKIALAVHHKAEQILAHFGNGRRFGVDIHYLVEPRKLGTAGALSLLPRSIEDPLIVMNGDILTNVDFNALLDFHDEEGCAATLCVRDYEFQVPFGVVQSSGTRLRAIVEKPVQRFHVNAGIYVLDPSVLRLLRKGAVCGMPDLLRRVLRRPRAGVSCFPIREYWIDIGRAEEYRRAQDDYAKLFLAGGAR